MKKNKKLWINNNQNGVALLLTVIILSIVTSIAILVANIVITQLKLSKDIDNSQAAIFAADSGIEWQLYQIRKSAIVPMPTMSNGATINVTVTGVSPNFNIKSLGSYQSVK